jgi:energy-coupling factor transport system ATP-binding protein
MITRSHSRWAPLRVSLWAALWFIGIRLVYRIVFLGASGSGITLWNIHPIHLPGPFSLITIGGRVTTGGLVSTVVDALPFAALIVVFGLLFSLVDARRAIAEASRFPFGRGFLTAVAIGASTYPSLVTSWRSIRQVHRFRRESGRFSVFAPLLERTLERSQTLAASMEVRGFGHSVQRPDPDCAAPLVSTQLTLGVSPALSEPVEISTPPITLSLGDVVLLTGPTGSGKTTLLRALTGLHVGFDHGSLTGSISIGGLDRATLATADTAHFVGFVSQRARDSFVAATVAEELGFGLQMQGMPRGAREVRLREVVALLGIEHLLERRVETLSAGQAVLVAIGAALATRPTLLLLDEPFADLDAHQSQLVAATLARLAAHTQMCIVIAEHRTEFVAAFATRTIALAALVEPRSLVDPRSLVEPVETTPTHPITALVGPNGCGKTTRLVAHATANFGTVTLIPENLADFFTRDTIARELARSDHTARGTAGTTRSTFEALIGTRVSEAMHPRDLSAGQQLALAIAIGLAGSPHELLIDEPTRGLDARARGELVRLLNRAANRTAITVATHDEQFIEALHATREEVTA